MATDNAAAAAKTLKWRWTSDYRCYTLINLFSSDELDYDRLTALLVQATGAMIHDAELVTKLHQHPMRLTNETSDQTHLKRALVVCLAQKATLIYESATSRVFTITPDARELFRRLVFSSSRVIGRSSAFSALVFSFLRLLVASRLGDGGDFAALETVVASYRPLLEAAQFDGLNEMVHGGGSMFRTDFDELLVSVLKHLHMLSKDFKEPFLRAIETRLNQIQHTKSGSR